MVFKLYVSINYINGSLKAIIDIILYGSNGVKTEKFQIANLLSHF